MVLLVYSKTTSNAMNFGTKQQRFILILIKEGVLKIKRNTDNYWIYIS